MEMKLRHQQTMHNEALNDLEEEAKRKSEHLRQAAEEKRQEQEDEIKHLNEASLINIQVNFAQWFGSVFVFGLMLVHRL